MSITAPPGSPTDNPNRKEQFGFDAWSLCAEFVETILADAQAATPEEQPIPEVDRTRIWWAGDGAPSDEAAIGRIVRAAWEVAHGIAPEAGHAAPAAGRHARVSATPPGPLERWSDTAVPAAFADGHATETPTTQASTVVRPPPRAYPAGTDAFPVTPATPLVGPTTPEAPERQVPAQDAPVFPVPRPQTDVSAGPRTVEPEVFEPHQVTAEIEAIAVTRESPQEREAESAVDPQRSTRLALKYSRWVTVFTWIRNIGVITLLFVAWQLWGTAIAQHHAQGQLQSEFEAKVKAHHTSAPGEPTLIPASTFVPAGGDGSVVARLQIPAIGVDQYVVEGTNEADLSKGPGHYAGTAMPGQAGNVAIAGHRTTHGAPFNRIGQLALGDPIILTTTSGQSWTYVVSAKPVAVSPHDVAVLNYFGDNRITLTTCNPEYSATQRLIVVGALKEHVATPAVHSAHVTYHVVNSSTTSWNWPLLPGVGLIVSLLALLGLTYRRFRTWFGSIGMWLILVPLWGAGLYLLFTTLTNFLPSSY
jgi:sortase A